MKATVWLGAATALAAALLASPATAQSQPDAHHAAQQRVLLADWITRVQDELGQQLTRQRSYGGTAGDGVVRVKFRCSEDGHTDKVSVAKSSGSLDLDLAAARAVRRIAVMHPLPTGMKTDQIYFADIVFATEDNANYQRRINAARDAAKKSNGWFKQPGRQVIAAR